MSEKSLNELGKEIKIKSVETGVFKVDKISNYLVGDGVKNVAKVSENFYNKSEFEQDLYIKNFKKIVSGKYGKNTHNLPFRDMGLVGSGHHLLSSIYEGEKDEIELVERLNSDLPLKEKYIVTIANVVILLEDEDLSQSKYNFMFVTISPLKLVKPTVKFDFVKTTTKLSADLVPDVKLPSPVTGFMYPAYNDNAQDKMQITLYHKAIPISDLLDGILDVEIEATIDEEKSKFISLVKCVTGENIKPNELSKIYEKVDNIIEEADDRDDTPSIGRVEIKNILKSIGYEDVSEVDKYFEEIMKEQRELKCSSIVKDKNISINTNMGSLNTSPSNLGSVRQVEKEDGKYLLIKIDDDAMLEGFKLKTEEM